MKWNVHDSGYVEKVILLVKKSISSHRSLLTKSMFL